MKDFLNQELAEGDHAIIGTPYGPAPRFRVVQILGFSAKMVRITSEYTWSSRKSQSVYPNQLVKIMPEQLTWYAITKPAAS